MELKLVRKKGNAKFTEGQLFVDGEFQCYTVEDAVRILKSESDKVYGQTAIPSGKYSVTISMSKRFNKFLIEILDVPYFKGIRIHSGNSSADTEGCIIVGARNKNYDDDFVENSRIAYDAIHKKVKEALSNNEKVTIEVT